MPTQIPGTVPAPPPPMPLNQLMPGQQLGAYNSVQGTIDPATGTAAGQLGTLMQSSSPLEQLAQSQGMNEAAARGSANGTLFAGASMAELNKNLAPIALNDANAYNRQQLANQAEANQAHDTETSANASEMAAGISANASMYGADVNATTQANALRQNQQQFTTNWANEFQTAKNSQAFQTASQATQNEFTAKMTAFQSTMQTVLSDPSYWNNPDGATGMVNYFTHAFDDIWSSTFGTPNPDSTVPPAHL